MSVDIEELLQLLEESDENPASDVCDKDESKLKGFISEYKIVSGIDRIPNYVIYYTYKVKYKGELSKVEFFRQLTKLGFMKARTGKQRVYLLDSSSFDLSREGLIEAEFFTESCKRNKNGKEQKKKGRKVSEP